MESSLKFHGQGAAALDSRSLLSTQKNPPGLGEMNTTEPFCSTSGWSSMHTARQYWPICVDRSNSVKFLQHLYYFFYTKFCSEDRPNHGSGFSGFQEPGTILQVPNLPFSTWHQAISRTLNHLTLTKQTSKRTKKGIIHNRRKVSQWCQERPANNSPKSMSWVNHCGRWFGSRAVNEDRIAHACLFSSWHTQPHPLRNSKPHIPKFFRFFFFLSLKRNTQGCPITPA